MLRSSWIKWARAAEHQRLLAREGREWIANDSYVYDRTDNASDATNPVLAVHWRLRIIHPYPERWSVLIGDVLTNLRAALDHSFWAAVEAHSGTPAEPHRVTFPIHTERKKFTRAAKDLQPLVAPPLWDFVESVQPFHGGSEAHTQPLEILRWMSNVDKHRAVHVLGRTAFDFGPLLVRSAPPMEVVQEWRREGPTGDGDVIARVKLRRPPGGTTVDLVPTFAHTACLQISDDPGEVRSLHSVMDVMREHVLGVLASFTDLLGEPYPKPGALELGENHDQFAPEFGGAIAVIRELDGTTHRVNLDHLSAEHEIEQADPTS
ncbi:hypothetical protein [Amycolatopsis sp. ATCC 39116]|uniref:hypothetical protein n=1 Tax=Amycolatopsis sp. (strain ATCC 39116 / 75iv2) TaxID=385957 RepID=UPI00026288DE|nr:hypothetical protein [Amycolatopsis sp. ATCC 39116]